MDLTIDLRQTKSIINQHQIKTIFPTTLWISYLKLPLTILYKPLSKDHEKPLPIAKVISIIHYSPKNNATGPYMSAESYTDKSTNYKI